MTDVQNSLVQHWVGGEAFAGTSTRTAPVYNPARGAPSPSPQ